ncbi:KH domain-containing protein [Patescibacteria group bacterium]|nr:KH domain-containing protein [Patescibacteria group bacterium]
MKKFLKFIVSSIVENPKEVEISETEGEGIMEYSIKAKPDDLKYVIGKSGRTINAIRTLARIKASKLQKRINININEQV